MEPTHSILDTQTGQTIHVPQSQLARYGINLPAQQPQPQAPTSQPQGGGNPLFPLGGSIIGSLLGIPFGPAGVIGGGALGGAAGAALGGGNIPKEALLGGLGGLFPAGRIGRAAGAAARAAEEAGAQGAERVFYQGGRTAPFIGFPQATEQAATQATTRAGSGIFGKAAERMAMASNKINPSQFVSLKETLGQNPGRFLLSGEGGQLLGKNPEQLSKIIQPIQQSFTDLAEHQGVTVHPADIFQTLTDQYNQLANTTGAAAKTKADALAQGIESFINKYGREEYATGIPMKEINKEAINVGKLVKDFDTAGTERSADRILRDAYRTGMQQATENAGLSGPGGETLKELGQRLNKLYELQGVVTKQEGLGQGTGLAGLTGLLGAGIGGPAGGIGGAALGFGAVKLSQNPKVLAFMARNADRLGNAIPQGLGSTILGQTGARVLGGIAQPTEAQAAETNQPIKGQVIPEQNTTQQDILRQRLGMYALSRAKNVSDLISAYGLLYPKNLQQDPFIMKATSNIDEIMKSKNLGYGPVGGKAAAGAIQHLGGAGVPPDVIALNQRYQLLKLNILRAYQGARISDADFRLATLYSPTISDTDQTARTKLTILKQILSKSPNAEELRMPPPANYPGIGQ